MRLKKFADTILKKYSSTIATIFTAIMSWAMFGHKLTMNFLIGVSIVFISMHQFFTFGDKGGSAKGHHGKQPPASIMYSPSMEHLAELAAGRSSDAGGVANGVGSADDAQDKRPLLPR